MPSTLCLTQKIHLQPTGMMDGFGGTSSQVPCLTKTLNSSDITCHYLWSFRALETHDDYIGCGMRCLAVKYSFFSL